VAGASARVRTGGGRPHSGLRCAQRQAALDFHTIPKPGEFGHDTWEGDSWKQAGGTNNWGGMSVDLKRGLVFAHRLSVFRLLRRRPQGHEPVRELRSRAQRRNR